MRVVRDIRIFIYVYVIPTKQTISYNNNYLS